MRPIVRVVVVASLTALASVGMTGVASAHANLLSSNPAGGSTLQSAPTQLVLNYSEEPDPQLSQVELLNSSGATVDTGTPTLQGQKTLVVPITGDMPDGVYTVSWSAVSVDDGHTTTDSFSFGVGVKAPPTGTAAAAPPPTASGPTVLAVAGKALLYAGLMLVVAVAVIGEGVFGGAPKARPRLAAWAGPASVVGSIGLLVSQQQATHASMSRFLGSQAARTPVALALACVITAVLAFVASRRSNRWLPWAAGIVAAIAMALRAHGGHADATSTPLLSQAEQSVHMIAGACWAGGLVLLIVLIRERRDDPPVVLARRYSTVALSAIAVVVATGILRSISELGGLGQLVHIWDSSYGRTLAIKVAVVLVVIALGAINRYRSVGRLATDASPLRRIASTEVVAAVGILLLTATLTSYSPPANGGNSGPTPPSDVVAISGSDIATTTTVSLTVTPAQPGPNLYRATVTAFGTDTPVQADSLTVQLHSVTQPNLPGASVTFRADGTGGWVAQSLDPSTPGTFAMQAQIRSSANVTEVPLTLVTRSTGTITTGLAPDNETVANASFTDGVRLQGTSSPGTPTQIHLTAFASDQTELPLADLELAASPATGPPIHLKDRRFSPGHFAASPTLTPGTWTIDAVATTNDGQAYQVTWQATVTP
jgi:copper transport protein